MEVMEALAMKRQALLGRVAYWNFSRTHLYFHPSPSSGARHDGVAFRDPTGRQAAHRGVSLKVLCTWMTEG